MVLNQFQAKKCLIKALNMTFSLLNEYFCNDE
jgi:hypothetical protein